MGNTIAAHAIFLTLVRSPQERERARLLIDSIRSFGGALSHHPIWLFEANPEQAPCTSLESMGVQVLSLTAPDTVRHYEFGDKVCACARAEELATPGVQTFIWINPECLIIQPPVLLDLAPSFDAAVRPVHIKSIGLDAAAPLDDFWKEIYKTVGAHDVQTTVESFVDAQHIRAYFNTHVFAVNASKGLFRRWFKGFEALVCDQEFQLRACQGERHRIFLHQAVLSTLVVTMLDAKRLRILPPEYSYPYNLHTYVPPDRRARLLNDLVCIAYEDRSLDPNGVDDINIDEPLRSWLANALIKSDT